MADSIHSVQMRKLSHAKGRHLSQELRDFREGGTRAMCPEWSCSVQAASVVLGRRWSCFRGPTLCFLLPPSLPRQPANAHQNLVHSSAKSLCYKIS